MRVPARRELAVLRELPDRVEVDRVRVHARGVGNGDLVLRPLVAADQVHHLPP